MNQSGCSVVMVALFLREQGGSLGKQVPGGRGKGAPVPTSYGSHDTSECGLSVSGNTEAAETQGILPVAPH